jgi:hypothetical protein
MIFTTVTMYPHDYLAFSNCITHTRIVDRCLVKSLTMIDDDDDDDDDLLFSNCYFVSLSSS